MILEVKRDADAFNVSLAWSDGDGELPLSAAMAPTDQPVDGKLRFSLTGLWDTRPAKDPWYWRTAPLPSLAELDAWTDPPPDLPIAELERRLDELATDALNHLGSHAGRYFRALVEQRGRRGNQAERST